MHAHEHDAATRCLQRRRVYSAGTVDAHEDRIHEVVDYDFIRLAIQHRIEQGHINLQEALSRRHCARMLGIRRCAQYEFPAKSPMVTTTWTPSASKFAFQGGP